MLLLYFFSFVSYLTSSTIGHLVITDEDYRLLPPLYEMNDDYQSCHRFKNVYCKASVKLKPLDRNSTVWKLIEATKYDKLSYNHDEIARTFCVPSIYKDNPKEVERFVTNFVNKEIEEVNLTSAVEYVKCKKKSPFGSVDYLIKNLLFGYFAFVLAVTVYDIILKKYGHPIKGNILTSFSLRRSYDQIFEINRSSHYQQLKCIQAFRTLTCSLVIVTHTKMSFLASFVENTEYIEMSYPFFYINLIFDFFLTQTFSLISAWLLTVQVLGIFEANKEFTVKDALLIFINRCCRMWPALICFLAIYRKAIVDVLLDDALLEVAESSAVSCENSWLYTLLFVQNVRIIENVCNAGFWFISMDVQLYATCLVVLYLMLKFGYGRKLLILSFFVAYGLFGTVIYVNNLDVVFRIYPETAKWQNFIIDKNFVYLYSMPYVSLATYLVGIGFGMYYRQLQQHKIANKMVFDFVWMTSFFGLPVLAVAIATKEFNGVSAALIGPLLKPTFSFGVGMGILGMSQSKDGIIKKIFEWRPLEFLGQFTFSVYVFHFFIVYLRTVMHQPLKISNYVLVTSGISDIILGFLIGFVMYLLVELPWSNIQKVYLPQVKKKSIKND